MVLFISKIRKKLLYLLIISAKLVQLFVQINSNIVVYEHVTSTHQNRKFAHLTCSNCFIPETYSVVLLVFINPIALSYDYSNYFLLFPFFFFFFARPKIHYIFSFLRHCIKDQLYHIIWTFNNKFNYPVRNSRLNLKMLKLMCRK